VVTWTEGTGVCVEVSRATETAGALGTGHRAGTGIGTTLPWSADQNHDQVTLRVTSTVDGARDVAVYHQSFT
jgi:hypothetical protein